MLKLLRTRASALLFALVAAFVVAPAAMAQGTVGDTVSAAIALANPQIIAVIGAMAAALVIVVTWKLVKRAFGG